MIKTKISATPSISVKHVICITLILYFAVSIAQFFMLNHNNALVEVGQDKRRFFIKLYLFMFIGFALYSLYAYVFINVMYMFNQWINVSRICLRIRNQFPNYIAAISELFRLLSSPIFLYFNLVVFSIVMLISSNLIIEDIRNYSIGVLIKETVPGVPRFRNFNTFLILIFILIPMAIGILNLLSKFKKK